MFNGPCDPENVVSDGPGYTGYSAAACCPVYGASCIAVNRLNGDLYLGMNFKTTASDENGNVPDFEPAVIAMDAEGSLKWWSRLYHEITPDGDTVQSLPDQYVDALAVDYTGNKLVVGARCHGNNTENFWEGNTIAADVSAYGFQNRFTGSSGNIHISWIGKLGLGDGILYNSTYLAELAEATGGLGTPHPDPNLGGWPDPNTGWPDVNTTRIAKNNMKVSSSGDVCIAAVGRRTITTANAYQPMVTPYYGGLSSWNSFVRVYDSDLQMPKYSSLIVGEWDTLTQQGGGNTEIYGVYKTNLGVVCVGQQTGDDNNVAEGNALPVTGVPAWGSSTPQNQSAVLVYYQALNLINENDQVASLIHTTNAGGGVRAYPNPASDRVSFSFATAYPPAAGSLCTVTDIYGRRVMQSILNSNSIDTRALAPGLYELRVSEKGIYHTCKLVIMR